MADKENPHAGLAAQGQGDEGNVNPFANTTITNRQVSSDLVLDIQEYCERSAPKPLAIASLLCGLLIVGGLASRSYNIGGTGLNQYGVLISPSGTGKANPGRCASKLFNEVAKSVPAINDFKGMGFLASGQGLIKMLDDKPYPMVISFLDEISHDFEEMDNHRNPNGKIKEKVLLQFWGLSGKGNTFDPMVYSDKDKNTKPIKSPALTIYGTTTAEKFNQVINDNFANNGMLARLLTVENADEIPPDNENHEFYFNHIPEAVVNSLANLASYALSLAQRGLVHDIEISPEAKAHFKEYGERVRHRLNATAEGPSKQLWNRSHEKALKLAGTIAVGQNYLSPRVIVEHAIWATGFIDDQTHKQVAKFANGDVGEAGGNEVKQLNELIKVIAAYIYGPFDKVEGYGGFTDDMHNDKVFTATYLSRRLIKLATFKNDRGGATNALNRALKSLLESDEIREIAKSQMQAKYGSGAKSYVVSGPTRFIKSWVAHK